MSGGLVGGQGLGLWPPSLVGGVSEAPRPVLGAAEPEPCPKQTRGAGTPLGEVWDPMDWGSEAPWGPRRTTCTPVYREMKVLSCFRFSGLRVVDGSCSDAASGLPVAEVAMADLMGCREMNPIEARSRVVLCSWRLLWWVCRGYTDL